MNKEFDVKEVVRQTVRTLAEDGANSEEGLDKWRKFYGELGEDERYKLTLELLGSTVGQHQRYYGRVPMMYAPDFLDNLIIKTNEFLCDHLKVNGEEHLARLLDAMVSLLIYQTNVDEDGEVSFINWQMAAEAVGDISQLYVGEAL